MKPDLALLCDQLQAELRLRDWRIDVSYVRDLRTRDGQVVHGLCSHLVDAKQAVILIRDPETPAGSQDPSVEETLIHELIHLHFAPLAGGTQAEIAAEEQAVWALTEALSSAKDANRRAQIARAMVAFGKRATGRAAPRLGHTRERHMDLAMLLAALTAAIASGDMKQVEALRDELAKQNGGAGGEQPPPATQGAPPTEEPPKMQQPPAEDPKTQKPVPAPASLPTAASGPNAPATKADLDRFQRQLDQRDVESLLERQGAHLNDAQRALVRKMTLAGAKEYFAAHAAPAAPAAKPGASTAERRQAPTLGAKRESSKDPNIVEVDRRMGLAPKTTQAISRDPHTGRLRISNIATGAVVKAGQ